MNSASPLITAITFWYLGISLLTLLIYALDKHKARNSRRRIAERTLHICSLSGGWPGALLAQKWCRHKTQKSSFRRVFWATVIINAAVLVVLLDQTGLVSLLK